MGAELGNEGDKPAEPSLAAADIAPLLRQAMAFHRAGLLEKASPLYRQVLGHRPDHREALHFLGVLEHQRGDDAAAVALITRAIALDDRDAAMHANLGIALRGCGELDAAVASYRRALALAPAFPEAHNNLGIALHRLGQAEEAIAHYRAALQHRPGYAEAHFNLAAALRSQGALEAALDACRSALKYRPRYADALHGLAGILAQLKRLDEAAVACEAYLAERPGDVEAIKSLADILVAMDREDDAIALYAAALDKHSEDAELLNNMGVALSAKDRLDEAAGAFAAALDRKPDFADAQYNLAVALERSGQGEAAIAAFETALRLRPDHHHAHQALGALYTALGRSADAVRVYRHWQAVAPDHPAARHMAAAVDQAQLPGRASDAYIRDTFASFAPAFDQVLAGLRYRVPELIGALLARFPSATGRPPDVLDAGCGTGLCSAFLRPLAGRLTGIDLSPEMLKKASERGTYDVLVEAELTSFMGENPASFDLIVIADTLVYFGDLATPLAAAAGCLRPGGRIAFNLERDAAGDPPGYRLNLYGRYIHGEVHLRQRLAAAGFTVLAVEAASIREQAGAPVQGLVALATK